VVHFLEEEVLFLQRGEEPPFALLQGPLGHGRIDDFPGMLLAHQDDDGQPGVFDGENEGIDSIADREVVQVGEAHDSEHPEERKRGPTRSGSPILEGYPPEVGQEAETEKGGGVGQHAFLHLEIGKMNAEGQSDGCYCGTGRDPGEVSEREDLRQ
jgi:hypothetical protein